MCWWVSTHRRRSLEMHNLGGEFWRCWCLLSSTGFFIHLTPRCAVCWEFRACSLVRPTYKKVYIFHHHNESYTRRQANRVLLRFATLSAQPFPTEWNIYLFLTKYYTHLLKKCEIPNISGSWILTCRFCWINRGMAQLVMKLPSQYMCVGWSDVFNDERNKVGFYEPESWFI